MKLLMIILICSVFFGCYRFPEEKITVIEPHRVRNISPRDAYRFPEEKILIIERHDADYFLKKYCYRNCGKAFSRRDQNKKYRRCKNRCNRRYE